MIFETAEATLVGPGVGADPSTVARAEAIATEISPPAHESRQDMDLRATPQSVTIAVPAGRLQPLVAALHDALVVR
jgi:hypothetical protein